jgi:uncharacterized protein (UPF0332 family)
MLIDLDECFAKGLIRKTAPSKEQALLSLAKAEEALNDAQANLEDDRYNATILLAYSAILSASKAVLLKDGFREKSHACIVRYLEAKHSKELDWHMISLLDSFRDERHDVQCSASFKATESQAEEIVKFSREFLAIVEDIIS